MGSSGKLKCTACQLLKSKENFILVGKKKFCADCSHLAEEEQQKIDYANKIKEEKQKQKQKEDEKKEIDRKEREEFSKYVCKQWGLEAPGAILWSQRHHLIKFRNFTHKEIMVALHYLFDVQNISREIVSLGLVEKMIPVALEYYEKRQNTRKKAGDSAKEMNFSTLKLSSVRDIDREEKKIKLLDYKIIEEE